MGKDEQQDPGLPPPPSYSENSGPSTEPTPGYEAPTYGGATGDSTRIVAATAKFPPTLNGYMQWKLTTTIILGPSKDEKLFAVKPKMMGWNTKQHITLYDGPSSDHPVLATAHSEHKQPAIMTLMPRAGAPADEPPLEVPIVSGTIFDQRERRFSIDIGGGGAKGLGPRVEDFQWRNTYGDEMKALAGHTNGWKLVWLSGPEHGAGGSRKERDAGFTSDGREIVAIVGHNGHWSMTKAFKFAFMGSGLTGTLGERWEVATVMSAVWFWYLDYQIRSSTATTTAAAV